MGGSPYAAVSGRLKAILPSLLSKEAYGPLIAARDLTELWKLLEPTPYGPELSQGAATLQGAPLFESAVNRVLVRRLRLLMEATPFAGKALVRGYLRRWDIENILLLLSAKEEGRAVTETECALVSDRAAPAGLFGGPMGIDDFRLLLAQASLEAIANQLIRFGYGATLLPLTEAYHRTHDIFPIRSALEREYYAGLLASAQFFQGDEWVIREFLRSEIDAKNVRLLLKGKEAGLPLDLVQPRLLPGGGIPPDRVPDLYGARTVPELVAALESRYPSLPAALPEYRDQHSLVPFEMAILRERTIRELRRLRAFPLSITAVFGYLLLSELERADLRKVVYGKLYGLPPAEVTAALIVPGL